MKRFTRIAYLVLMLLGLLIVPSVHAQGTPDQILYAVRKDSGDLMFYTVNIDGGVKNQIGVVREYGSQAGWSPDGNFIYLLENTYLDHSTLTLVDAKTNRHQTIPDRLEPATCSLPFWWSPNGEWLAYSTLSDSQTLLKMMNPVTGDVQILAGADLSYGELHWSNDGRYVTYPTGFSTSGSGYRFVIYDLHNQKTVSVLNVTASSEMSWSPIENRIVFKNSDSLDINVYNLADGTKQEYKGDNIGIWSPDGQFLTIYHRDINDKFLLSVIDVVANKTLELDGVISEPGVDTRDVVWSSDGRYLAVPVIEYQVDYRRTIYVLDIADRTSRRLTLAPVYYNKIAWSPVGDWLTFASRSDSETGTSFTSLWLFDVFHQTHQEFEVEFPPYYYIYNGNWSADGRYIIVGTQAVGSIVLIDRESGQITPIAASLPKFDEIIWSPYGSRAILTSQSYDIYVFTPENHALVNITNTSDEIELFYAWQGTKRNKSFFNCG
ncbi:MAG: hypothetical protein H0X30_33480 [Anaerolineae bacterium]|nr:hypothetical protein [Anaerolineae bacterium]